MRYGRSLAPALLAFALAIGGLAGSPGLTAGATGSAATAGTATTATAASSASWTQFHYSATRSAYNPLESRLNAGNVGRLTVKWERQTASEFLGSPVVGGGRIFVLDNSGKLYALRQSDGRRLWSASIGADFNTTPAIWKDLVLVPGRDATGGFVAAYGAASGSRHWRTRLNSEPYEFVGAPAVFGNTFYLAAGGTVYALSAGTGRILWKRVVSTSENGTIEGPVAVSGHGEYVVAAGTDGRVYALNAATGTVKWTANAGGGIDHGGPAIYSGIVYVAEGRGGDEGGGFDICALQVSDGRLLWKGYAGDDVHVTPAAGQGMVVIGSIDEGLRALDSRTGALLWAAPYEGEVWGDPILANGVVYAGTDTSLVAHNARTGAPLYTLQLGSSFASMSSPAVINGRVYTGSGRGAVLVLGLP
jgi:outer membrane protein assembly factor BamB